MEKQLTEQESLHLITSMIQKAKASYHDRGTSSILWGSAVSIASFTVFLERTYNFSIGFDAFLLVLFAFVPQIFISIKESKQNKVVKFEDAAVNAVWLVYAVSIFGLIFYQNVIGNATMKLMQQDGYTLVKHYLNGTTPDEPLKPFPPSIYSLFILLYAMPTFITGLAKKFKPMIIGGIITYAFFAASCFTSSRIDMLLGTFAAISCWLIPGIILRRRYLAQNNHV